MAPHSSILAWRIPIDRGAWWATVHGVTKSWTWLSDFYFTSSNCWQREKLRYKEYRWQFPQIGSASGRSSLLLLTGKFCEWVVGVGVCVRALEWVREWCLGREWRLTSKPFFLNSLSNHSLSKVFLVISGKVIVAISTRQWRKNHWWGSHGDYSQS